jgi:hypothetical protein
MQRRVGGAAAFRSVALWRNGVECGTVATGCALSVLEKPGRCRATRADTRRYRVRATRGVGIELVTIAYQVLNAATTSIADVLIRDERRDAA